MSSNPQEPSDYLDTPTNVTEALVHYFSQIVLASLDAGTDKIDTKVVEADTFTAQVGKLQGGGYQVRAYSGVAKLLTATLFGLDGGPAESIDSLSNKIFGAPDLSDVLIGSIVSSSIIFVFLHEYGHIAAGHFNLTNDSREPDALDFDELTSGFSFEGSPFNDRDLGHLLELEADVLAFNILLDLSFPIFSANSDVEIALAGREPEGWREDVTPEMAELMFYSAATALALLAVHRKPLVQQDNYPLPLTRLLNLAVLTMRRTIKTQWQSQGLEHRATVDDDMSNQMKTVFLPMLVNALELCQAACARISLDFRALLNLPDTDREAWAYLADDFVNVIRGRQDVLLTVEAHELLGAMSRMNAFNEFMLPYRVRDWWK